MPGDEHRQRPSSRGGRPRKAPITLAGASVEIRFQQRPNPHYNPAHAGASGNPRRISVAVNVNESPVARLHADGQIDGFQAHAAYKFRACWEALAKGTPSPGDIKERVDGAGAPDVFTERRMEAGRVMRDLPALLGERPYKAVRYICGEGRSFEEARRLLQCRRHRERALMIEGLDRLVEIWGLKPANEG